jgi:hypothetical protein
MRSSVYVAPLLLIASLTLADAVAPPPITSGTLFGVWEGIPTPPCQSVIYRLEITRDGPSYLAFTLGSEDLVYSLVSSEVTRGRITLRFHCLTDRRFKFTPKGGNPDLNDLLITGKGTAGDVGGTFEGLLKMRYRKLDDVESTPVAFCKPPWGENATEWSNKAKQLLENAKSHQ